MLIEVDTDYVSSKARNAAFVLQNNESAMLHLEHWGVKPDRWLNFADTKIWAIAACDPAGAIGVAGGMPWSKTESDLDSFKNATQNCWLLMGRKTVQSLPYKLPQRMVVGISTAAYALPKTVFDKADVWASSVDEAMRWANRRAIPFLVAAGGASVYDWASVRVERALITHVRKPRLKADAYLNPLLFAPPMKPVRVEDIWEKHRLRVLYVRV